MGVALKLEEVFHRSCTICTPNVTGTNVQYQRGYYKYTAARRTQQKARESIHLEHFWKLCSRSFQVDSQKL